jgi:putative transposon-encoded protein
MYYENCVDRIAVMKRRSTRHVSEITALATEYGNSAKIIVPRSWLRKRVIAFLYSDFISKYPEERRKDE